MARVEASRLGQGHQIPPEEANLRLLTDVDERSRAMCSDDWDNIGMPLVDAVLELARPLLPLWSKIITVVASQEQLGIIYLMSCVIVHGRCSLFELKWFLKTEIGFKPARITQQLHPPAPEDLPLAVDAGYICLGGYCDIEATLFRSSV